MIKINLLPAYINQRKRLKVAIAVVTLLVAAEVAGFVVYRQTPMREQEELEARLAQVNADMTKLKAVSAEAATVNAEEATFKPKLDFVSRLADFNLRVPVTYRNTAAYTYREAMLLSMNANGQQMAMSAYVSKPEDIARLMLGLSRNPEFNGLPTITGNPGYDPARDAALNQPRDPNVASTIMGGMMMPGGQMGGAGMMPGGQMGGAGMMPGAQMGGAGMRGGAGMMPGGQMGGAGMYSGIMGGGTPGLGGGGGGGRGDVNVLPIAGSRLVPRGFTVSISAPLKFPALRPSYGTADSQAGGGGAGGGMGGMMGGMMPGGQMGGGGAMMMPGAQMGGM